MSQGELCKAKTKIYNELPRGSEYPYRKCESIEVSCQNYANHSEAHAGTLVDVEGGFVGNAQWRDEK